MNAARPLQQLLTILSLPFLLCINGAHCIDHTHHTHPLTFPQSSSHGDLDCAKAFAGKGKPSYGGRAHAGLVHPHGPCSPIQELSHLSGDMPALALELLKKDQKRLEKHALKRGSLPHDVLGRSLATSTSSSAFGTTSSGQSFGVGNYVMKVGVGTPTRDFVLVLDTGSSLAWTQCTPCDSPTSCFQQASPLFDPTKSTSYSPLSCATVSCTLCSTSGLCQFDISYGDQSTTFGDLAQETFTIGIASIQNYTFGCAHSSQGTFEGVDGLLGLGWDALSIPDQTLSFFGGVFAYCLPSILSSTSTTGFIEFGVEAVANNSIGSYLTPMIHNVHVPGFYYVWLKAISVGGVPLSLASTSSIAPTSIDISGTIIDSGTIITRLPSNDYVTFRNAFLAGSIGLTLVSPQVDSVFDTCFQFTASSRIPIVTFHFNGLDFPLDSENMLFPLNLSTNIVCLAFAPLPTAMANEQLLIIGNHQMAGFLFTFDTVGSELGILTSSKVC